MLISGRHTGSRNTCEPFRRRLAVPSPHYQKLRQRSFARSTRITVLGSKREKEGGGTMYRAPTKARQKSTAKIGCATQEREKWRRRTKLIYRCMRGRWTCCWI